MRQVKKLICVAVLALFMLSAYSQEMHKQWIDLTTKSNSLNYKLPGKRYYMRSSFMGSPFISDKWCLTDLILENGDRYDSLQIRLNSYLDEIIMYNERVGATVMLDKSAISEFNMRFADGHNEHFKKKYFDDYLKSDRYFSFLHDGKLKLLLWYKTVNEKTTIYADAMGIMHDTEYRLTKNYYVEFPDNKMVKTTLKRRSFLELFPEQKKQARQIIRKNKLRFETEEDLVKAVHLFENIF